MSIQSSTSHGEYCNCNGVFANCGDNPANYSHEEFYKEKETILAELKSVTQPSIYTHPDTGNKIEIPSRILKNIWKPRTPRCGIEVLDMIEPEQNYFMNPGYRTRDDYLTIAKLKQKCIENGIKCKSKWKRIDYIQALMKV